MKQINTELVSVVIVTRDRPVLLQRAVESVLSQTYPQIEIVVVDNMSKNPPDFRSLGSRIESVKVVRTESFLTASASRNYGVSQANGDFICFLDDDDYYLPNKIQVLADVLNADNTTEMAYGNTQMLGPNRSDLGVCVGPPEISQLLYYRYIHLNAVMVRKNTLKHYAFDENMTTYEDADLMFRIVKHCKCVHVDMMLAVWNRDNRPDQLTSKNWGRAESNWLIICKKFSSDIRSNFKVSRLYYKKMSQLSFYNWHVMSGIYFGLLFIFFGWIKQSPNKSDSF